MSDNIPSDKLSNNEAVAKVKESTSASEVFEVFEQYYQIGEHAKSTKGFGVEKIKGVAIATSRKAANQAAMDIVEKYRKGETLTSDDLDALKGYTGLGGIGATISEYYTPEYVAEGTWDALKANGFENGNVCEPSCGAGVFNGTKPDGVVITGSEIDSTSSTINTILHPEDEITNQSFEELAMSVPDGHFDSFIGNVPFGDQRGKYAQLDPQYSKVKHMEQYFVTRAIDKTKAGGLIALVVPTQIIDRKTFSKFREEISLKAEFLGAHRMPSGVFSNNGTDVVTDVLLMQKHSEDLFFKIADLEKSTLKSANVLFDSFISGKWFEKEGKRFVMGETSRSDFQNRLQVARGELTNDAIKNKLAHKFDSRIDFELIEATAPTVIVNYNKGDTRLINGGWFEFDGEQWEPSGFTIPNSGKIDKAIFGTESYQELSASLETAEQALALKLNSENIKNVAKLTPRALSPITKHALDTMQKADKSNHDLIYRGTLIGQMINEYMEAPSEDQRLKIIAMIKDEQFKTGIAKNNKAIAGLSRSLDRFINATDSDGNLSDLMSGKAQGVAAQYDFSDPVDVVNYLFLDKDLMPVNLTEFNDLYTGDDLTIEQLAKFPEIAFSASGDSLYPFDRYCSGDIKQKLNDLSSAIMREQDPAVKAKFIAQQERINERRKKTSIDDIKFELNAKWMQSNYVTEFLASRDIDMRLNEQTGRFVTYSESNTFAGQLEQYLNNEAFSKRKEDRADNLARIHTLQSEFDFWIRQHADADYITNQYNMTFNANLPFEHGEHDLGLDQVSGKVKNMPFQNKEIRRMSEDGRGILAFGTGLGKSHTANGLVALDLEKGRCTKVCYAVPKSLITNWYHETKHFFGDKRRILFVGLEPVKNKKGVIQQDKWLDKDGEHKINDVTGELEYRDQVKELGSKEILARMATIPHTNYDIVVMTKEQLAAIPMRPSSMEKYVDNMVNKELMSGADAIRKLGGQGASIGKDGYKQAKQKEGFQSKYHANQTTKSGEYPFWEDMRFDKLIIDEAHNYRNAFKAGRRANEIAYLPTGGVAKSAADLAIKSSYLREQNGGKGIHMLTATPTVNSPTDIFNMLSHVMTPAEWEEYGIYTVDDFIKVFGRIETMDVQKLSGEVESKEGLAGFKNLDALRSIYHRWVIAKEVQDVATDVKMPDKKVVDNKTTLNQEQLDIYEELQDRALNILDAEDEDGEPTDFIFSIIRDMDRVATDIDLYHKRITFVLPKKHKEVLSDIVIPSVITEKKEIVKKAGEKLTVVHELNASVDSSGKNTIVVINENFEDEFIKALVKAGIDQKDINHPITPKYAKLIERLRDDYKNGGKQVIFTEEKSQHQKLKRIIANNLGVPLDQIGIINADTVSKGKKSTDLDKEAGALEDLADRFNTGAYKFLICNKKAEVGINLQHGSTKLHHLTIPWTPASLIQRFGRIWRIGGTQEFVTEENYLAEGSFDEFRLRALSKKASWQASLLKGDANSVDFEEVNDLAEARLLLAKNPEELKAQLEAQAQASKDKAALRAKQRISTALGKYNRLRNKKELWGKEETDLKELKATIKAAVQQGVIDTDPTDLPADQFVIEPISGQTVKAGDIYTSKERYSSGDIYEVVKINHVKNKVSLKMIFGTYGLGKVSETLLTNITQNYELSTYSASESIVKAEFAKGGKMSISLLSSKLSTISKEMFFKYATAENYEGFEGESAWQGNQIANIAVTSENVIYPSKHDQVLVTAFANYGLELIRANKEAEIDESMGRALFGWSYLQSIRSYGTKPTTHQLVEWEVAIKASTIDALKESASENLDDGLWSVYSEQGGKIKSMVADSIPDGYDDSSPFADEVRNITRTIVEGLNDIRKSLINEANRIKEEAEAARKEEALAKQTAALRERYPETQQAEPESVEIPSGTLTDQQLLDNVNADNQWSTLISDFGEKTLWFKTNRKTKQVAKGATGRLYLNLKDGGRWDKAMFIDVGSRELKQPNARVIIAEQHKTSEEHTKIRSIVRLCEELGVTVSDHSEFYNTDLIEG